MSGGGKFAKYGGFRTSRNSSMSGYEIICEADWWVSAETAYPQENIDDIKARMYDDAKSIGANALLDEHYEKGVGEDGNYKYTTFNFKGRPAVIAKLNGGYHRNNFLVDLNGNIEKKVTEWNDEYLAAKKKASVAGMLLFVLSFLGINIFTDASIYISTGAAIFLGWIGFSFFSRARTVVFYPA
jgi:hypothetical protein